MYIYEIKPCHFPFVLKRPKPLLGYTCQNILNRVPKWVYTDVAEGSGLLLEMRGTSLREVECDSLLLCFQIICQEQEDHSKED